MARYVLCGKNALAVGCLEAMLATGDEITAVYACKGDTGVDGWQPSLARRAIELGVPVRHRSINRDAGHLASVRPERIVSAQYDRILKPETLAAVRGAINIHYALLPRHRGCAPLAHAIMEGDADTGVTIHELDAGIDTGPIIAQARVPIAPDDTGRAVYDACTVAGVSLFSEWWPRIRAGRYSTLCQDERRATYHPAGVIDWAAPLDSSRPAREVYDRARALIFPPFQYPRARVDGEEVELLEIALEKHHEGRRPALRIPCADGAVLAYKIRARGYTLDGPLLAWWCSA